MHASIFSCSTAFLAWEMLAVLLLAMPSFMVAPCNGKDRTEGSGEGRVSGERAHGVNERPIETH